jgi:hypothetical protein
VGLPVVSSAPAESAGAGGGAAAAGAAPAAAPGELPNVSAYVVLHTAPFPQPCQKLICSNIDEGTGERALAAVGLWYFRWGHPPAASALWVCFLGRG